MHYKNVTCSEPRALKRFYGNAAGKQGEIHRIQEKCVTIKFYALYVENGTTYINIDLRHVNNLL